MKLTIEANTIEELMSKVNAIANHFNVDLSESTKTPVTAEVVEVAKTVEAEVEEAPKKEKKKKEKVEVVEEAKTFTKDDVIAALQKVSLEKAREILGKYNAKRISDVKETDYAAVVKECEA